MPTVYGRPGPDGKQTITTFEEDPGLPIQKVPVNFTGWGFADRIYSYELPQDPRYPPLPGGSGLQPLVPTVSAPMTAAEEADALRQGVARYQRELRALTGPQPDYGAGSNSRNVFYHSSERGWSLRRSRLTGLEGLEIDWLDAFTSGLKKGAGEAAKGLSLKAPGLPKIKSPISTPAWLKGLKIKAPNAGALAKGVKKEISDRRAAEEQARQEAAQAAAAPGYSEAPAGDSSWLLYAAAAAAAAFALARWRR